MRELFGWIGVSVIAMVGALLAICGAAAMFPDSAGGVEITPAACYAVAGENIAASGQHSALVLNTCTGKFTWVRLPNPPQSEV